MRWLGAACAVALLPFIGGAAALGQSVSTSASTSPSTSPSTSAAGQGEKKAPAAARKHKLGPLEISINWRTRAEDYHWFQGGKGNSSYTFGHSLFRLAVGQTHENWQWAVEASQATILGAPSGASIAAPQGPLGTGGNYFTANQNHRYSAGVFAKQAFVQFKIPGLGEKGSSSLKLGRYEFFDAMEVKPLDATVATLVQTRIAQRLLGNSNYSAAQRSFDGATFSWNQGSNDVTVFGARPTRGIYQTDGMGELNIDAFYGAFNRQVETKHGAGEFRAFAVGYIDDRTSIVKVDNRAAGARAADHGNIAIATFGADYIHAFRTDTAGTFDVVGWGAVQTGSWGSLAQRSGAFVGEGGWQPPIHFWKPWLSVGYSYGSGDGNPNDKVHSTYFQALPTPRMYSRFSFYNMMNNEDLYAILQLHPTGKLALRSEAHTLRLSSAADDWYQGSGASQLTSFGFTGRSSGGGRGLANVWDLSVDYPLTRYVSATLYYAHAWGKGAIGNVYPRDRNAQLAYLETDFRF